MDRADGNLIRAARAARLLYLSPGRIHFLTPAEAAPGAAVLRLTREGEQPVELALTIGAVAPGLFSINGARDGIGVMKIPAALARWKRASDEEVRKGD